MAEHIFLMFNMGNSGGKWLEDICNIHEDVRIWQEANHYLKVTHLDNQKQLDVVYDFFMEQYKENSKKTIGLSKAFDDRLIKFTEKNNGSIIQIFRHPVGVVNFKIGHKMEECRRRKLFQQLDTEEKIFEAHVEFYASRYRTYTDNASKWPLIRLEDLKKSLRKDRKYFEGVMIRSLNVNWQSAHTEKVIGMGGLGEDLSYFVIWESWENWKRDIFLKYFEEIMKVHGYKWER